VVHTGVWWGKLRGVLLEDPNVGGRIILKWIFEKWDGGTDWINLVQDRDRWRAVVNAVMNLRVP
jgi:predicted double-glycine peptidase